jgi:hypothetical protein
MKKNELGNDNDSFQAIMAVGFIIGIFLLIFGFFGNGNDRFSLLSLTEIVLGFVFVLVCGSCLEPTKRKKRRKSKPKIEKLICEKDIKPDWLYSPREAVVDYINQHIGEELDAVIIANALKMDLPTAIKIVDELAQKKKIRYTKVMVNG